MAYLHSGEYYAGVRVLELRNHALADVLTLLIAFRLVSRQRVQDRYASPLRALVQSDQ